jgi:hypothetical protein
MTVDPVAQRRRTVVVLVGAVLVKGPFDDDRVDIDPTRTLAVVSRSHSTGSSIASPSLRECRPGDRAGQEGAQGRDQWTGGVDDSSRGSGLIAIVYRTLHLCAPD